MIANRTKRTATTTVECALVYPALFLLVLGLLVGSAGVFRYQQMASIARKAARYAVVHGTQSAKDIGGVAPTAEQIYQAVIKPNAILLDLSKLSYSITYDSSNAAYRTSIVNGEIVGKQNTVKVTLTYNWVPEIGLLKHCTFSSTSIMPMAN